MSAEQLSDLVKESVEHIRAQEWDQAIDAARRAIEANHRDPEAYSALGIALSYAGRLEEAVDPLQRAIQSAPYEAKHYFNLAVHNVRLGHMNEAIAMCQEAIRCDGKHQGAHLLLKELEKQTHTEAAPYMSSIGDQRGSAYHYRQDKKEAPPPYDPLADAEHDNTNNEQSG